jgi:hypothetical protein
MINIDTRLLDLIPDIGADSFVVLCLISKRLGKRDSSFPSVSLLKKESGFGRNKVFACLKILKEKGFLKSEQRHIKGRLSSNLYTITTKLIFNSIE